MDSLTKNFTIISQIFVLIYTIRKKIETWSYNLDVTNSGNGERGTGNGEQESGN